MPHLEVFDPPMCCSTGVCGPAVDPVLPRFAGDLEFLVSQGVAVTRHNLAQEPGAFASADAVRTILKEKGNDSLPILVVDGKVVSESRYPEREELLELVVPASAPAPEPTQITPLVQELMAVAAAVASHSDQAFRFHLEKAKEHGASRADLTRAVETALMVQDGAARTVLRLAGRHLGIGAEGGCDPESGCC